ncbi:hypothetical protein PPERSA_08862 [Pseudocohnilembus persalinus]|uniref:MIR domain protein n=1 Tax=Pseudocohnilembus persalinus TaxID=266149 RepID=A0A0V0R420_PSEPJ|nr:hypothetical protein PPERSA_08862 [Pseudocohnilembus persalinus]|eukprot:KRX09146.1 hypothetical protein PPERSA_08862 [Pseudocohnilembus persalinus]
MLHEWMLLEYPKLNAQIMDYLFNKFSQKQKFMENAQLSYMINSENIQIFDKLIGLYHEMHFCIIDLDYASFTNEETIEKEQKIYQNLNQQMLQVVGIFFVNEEIRSNYENMLRKQMENIDAEQQVFSIFTGKKIKPQKKVTIDQELVLDKQKQVLQLDELKDSKKQNKEVQKAVKNGKEGNKNEKEKEKKKNNKKSKNQKKQESMEEELRIQMGLKIGPYNFEDQTQLQGGFKRDLDDDFPESDQSDVIEDDAEQQAEDGNTAQQIKTQSNKLVSEILQQETTKLKENQSTISPFSQILAPKKNLKRKSKFAQRVSQQLQQNLLKKSIFYRIFENYNIRIEELHQNQNFLKGLNYHQNILHLLQLASAANTKIWKTEELKQVKIKLMETCICVLTYFVLRNQENAQIILKNPLTADVITKVTAEKDLKIQKISYIFINELYQNHFQLVLNFSLEFNTDIIRRMIMKQNTNLSQIGNESYKLELAKKQKDKKRKLQILDEINSGKNDHCVTSFIYFLETLPKFFKIKDKSLQQNQEHISRLFQTECGNLRAVILDIFEQVMKEKIQVNANNEYEKEQVISSKQIILLCFLKNFRQLLSRCSTESINYARSIFSLQDLKRIIISQEDFYPLKLEAIMFLTDIYISGKNIEDNDYQEIYNLFKNHLFKQLNDFSGQIMHRLEYTDVRFINKQIQNIFSTNYLYSAQDYLLNIPYFLAYEQYILFGITRAFLYFQEKMPDTLSDNDAYLIQEYQDFCDKYMVDYFQRPDKYRRQRNTHQRKSQRGLTVLGIPGKNINSTGDKENAVLETSSHSFNQKLQLVKILVDIFSYDYVKITLVNGFKDEQYQEVQAAFNVQINKQQKNFFIEKKQLEMEHEKELNLLTQLLLQVKLTDPDKFKSYLYQYINILSQKKQNYTSSNSAMKVLRKISNYKQNMDVAESIQKDLCSLGFLKYICEVIINESESQKLEYIVGLVDFLDEANKDIQENFYQYLLEDDQMNYFILQIKTILDNNFKQFREYERSKTEIKQVYNYVTLQEQSGSVFTKQQQQKINIIAFMGSILNQEFSEKDMNVIMEEFNKVIFNKLQICKYVLEVVRLGCENHFSSMQQYMRKQININKQLKKNPVNMIRVIADLFQRYSKIMNGANIDFGIQILDTLIEMIQGPCKENQFALVNTKILESLEDIMMDIHRFQHASKEQESSQHHQQQQHQESSEQNQQISGELLAFNRFKDVDQYKFSKFLMKVFLFISSLFEGDADPYILNKIDLFININLLFKIIQISYERYEKINKEINKESYSLYYLIKYRTQVEQIEGEIINFDFNSKKKTQIGELGNDIIYYSRANLQLKQAFSAFNLMQSLVQLSPNFASQYKEQLDIFLNQNKFLFKSNLKQQKIYQYFNENCISIEIINSANELQKVFFRKPLLTNYLSDTSKIRFEENVRRDSSTDKLNALLEQEQTFEDEMHHILRLSSILKRVNLQYLTYFRNINIVLIFIQNLFILFTSGTNMDKQSEDIVQTIKQVFGMIQMSSAIIIWLLFLLMEMPVDAKRLGRKYKKQMKKKYQQEASQVGQLLYAFYQLCVNSYLFYLSINIFISVMGFFYNQVFYSFLMLDIVDRFSVLKNVIRSITQNSTQLLMTALLGGVILYIYAIIGYSNQDIRDSFLYANETDINMCTSAFDCFIFILNSGLRQGGGVGDIIQMPDPFTEEKTYNLRVIFDLSFFIIMIIIWMNIVFGIIIDTFAELRDDKKQRDMDRNNVCFICNINRNQYENNNVNFEQHIQKDHYIWNYIYYIQHLKGKDQNDFDGTETYIYEKWQNGDLTWFPVGRSLSLDNQFEDSEDQIILNKLGEMDKNLEKIKQKIKFLS